jgi:hypothetical protein
VFLSFHPTPPPFSYFSSPDFPVPPTSLSELLFLSSLYSGNMTLSRITDNFTLHLTLIGLLRAPVQSVPGPTAISLSHTQLEGGGNIFV